MNKNNIEVELKYWVKDKDELMDCLEQNVDKSYEKHQIDKYFTPPHHNFVASIYPHEYLRIRRTNKEDSVTYKYYHKLDGGEENEYSHCDEYESQVRKSEQLENIFEALNFGLF